MSRFQLHQMGRDEQPSTGEAGAQGVRGRRAELIALRDTETGAEAIVWPGLGNNCIEARLPLQLDGLKGNVDALKGPPSLAELRKTPAFWGVPLLFPFPSRVPGGEYEFEGQRYVMPRDFHGFALDAAWRVVASEADDARAVLRSVLASEEHPETLEGYPFPYRVEATYTLDGEGLRLDVRVNNRAPAQRERRALGGGGSGNMPFGYGAHPYFRLPLGERGAFGECLIRVPAKVKWDRSSWTAPPHDIHGPLPLLQKVYNGVYADLDLVDGLVQCSVTDPANGVEAVMRATPNHPVVVVYTHAGAESVCFEPWTCPPNVFNLAVQGTDRHGLIVLAPGEEWTATMWLSVRRLGG